jgi:hypothetical protein
VKRATMTLDADERELLERLSGASGSLPGAASANERATADTLRLRSARTVG